MSRTRQPPNTANNNQSAYSNLDFSEPPDVQIVEASCDLAQKRSADNSEWTNILKEPLFVAKGSEIRCASSFLDMKGMDSEIIQFESSGNSQDNSHTLLTQIYTVNDGFNGKTTSSDYIVRPQLGSSPATTGPTMNNSYESWRIYNLGGAIVAPGPATPIVMLNSSGVDSGLRFNLAWNATHFPGSYTLVSGGTGYRTGDRITASYTGTPIVAFAAYAICDDQGAVVDFYIENHGDFDAANHPNFIEVSKDSGGDGCQIDYSAKPAGTPVGAALDNNGNAGPLDKYSQDNATGAISGIYTAQGTSFQIQVWATTAPDPVTPANGQQLIVGDQFDQGYNYQKVPLLRYCQTFDFNEKLTFANNFIDRTYTTGAGNNIILDSTPLELKEDSSLSAYGSIKRREDEFVPGVFHNAGVEADTPMLITSAFLELGKNNANLKWKFGWEDGYSVIYMLNNTDTLLIDNNQTTLEANVLNRFPIGCCLSLSFQLDENYDSGGSTEDNTKWAVANLNRPWGGVFQVGKNDYITGGRSITIGGVAYTSYRKITLGSPSLFKAPPVGAILGDSETEAKSIDFNYPVTTSITITGPQNTSQSLPLINVRRDGPAGETMTGVGAKLRVNFTGSGDWNQQFNFLPGEEGTGYKKGDILKVLNTDGTANNLLWYVKQVDDNNGTTFAAPPTTTLESSDMNNAGFDYACFICPQPYVQAGGGNIDPATQTADYANNVNGICVVKTIQRTAGNNHFINYPIYPPTFETLGLQNSDTITDTPFISKQAINGCYKYNGKNPSDIGYNNKTAQIYAHNLQNYTYGDFNDSATYTLTEKTGLNIQSGQQSLYKRVLGPLTAGDVNSAADIIAFDGSQAYMDIRADVLLANVANNFYMLPSNYIKWEITYAGSTDVYEEHAIVTHWNTHTPTEGAGSGIKFYRFYFRTRSTQQNKLYNFYTSDVAFGPGPGGGARGNQSLSGATGFGYELNAFEEPLRTGDTIILKFLGDESKFITRTIAQYGAPGDYGTGNIAFTSSTNFYNENDVNYNTLKTDSPTWNKILGAFQNVTGEELASYNNGGHYYLTHNHGYMRNLKGDNPDRGLDYSKDMGFSQGFNEFLLTRRIKSAELTTKNTAFFPTQSPFVQNLETNCTNIFGYEPLYKQKTFLIDRDFAVPSDIGGFWTRQSHNLLGIQDSLTGKELTTINDCGILQNEFIFPVYGSNNKISAQGEYIPNDVLFPDSAGLEPGHCIGICGIDSNSNYLNTEVKSLLPTDTNGNKINYVFFRTFFTQVRNYDPLKGAETEPKTNPPTYNGAPDRQAFETIHTKAGLIGNLTFRNGYVKKGPEVLNDQDPPASYSPKVFNPPGAAGAEVQRYTLDGNLTIDSTQNGPGAAGQANTFDHLMYELGFPNPGTDNEPAYFTSSSVEYPIRYLDNDTAGNFDRAKISSFVGSTNMTLAYQTDLSTFAFEFFYTPYTSPFIDGSGGDISSRIFYGNRPKGVYNHDALGGVNVVNWCRPDYDFGTITYRESVNNTSNVLYPNGVNPFTGVAAIGKRFMNKLGYTDQDLAITTTPNKTFQINQLAGNIGTTQISYTQNITLDAPASTVFAFTSYNEIFQRTNKGAIDSSAAILAAIPPPESSPGLNSHVARIPPVKGKSKPVVNRWGDYIFYPYSIDASSDTFNSSGTGDSGNPVDASRVRWDNATDTYASVGGLNLSEAARGMGTPNTTGSTTICNPNTIPVTLNPDCNIYLSYTVQTQSDFILASGLPRKLNHGHLIVISNLVDRPNYHLASAGAVNGISVINKSFITGDFILSIGQLSFFATEDRWLTRITTKIVNSSYEAPTTLGEKSTIIYQIQNNNPKPAQAPTDISTQQQKDYEMMAYMQEHQQQTAMGNTSRLANLHQNLYQLGIATIIDPTNNNASIVSQLEQYIAGYDLAGMAPVERREFYATPEGGAFLQAATNFANLRGQMEAMDEATDPEEAANLQQQVAVGLQAIDRGSVLPPIPMNPDDFDVNPQYDPEVPNLGDFGGSEGAIARNFSNELGVGSDVNVEPLPGDDTVPAIDLSMIPRQLASAGPKPPQTVKDEPRSDSGIGSAPPSFASFQTPSSAGAPPSYQTDQSLPPVEEEED